MLGKGWLLSLQVASVCTISDKGGNVKILVMMIVLTTGMGERGEVIICIHQVVGLIQIKISIIITHIYHHKQLVSLDTNVYATPKHAKAAPKGIIQPVEPTFYVQNTRLINE